MQFSVIIPCHNAGPWVKAALRSVAAQSLAAHEIIVINDASTDDSTAQIAASGVPVRVLEANLCNAAAARNLGIKAATGDWIAFLDADDVWYPQHLERAAAILQGGEDVAFMANHDWISLTDEIIPMPEGMAWHRQMPASSLTHDAFFDLAEESFHFGHSTVVYRADRVREVGGFEETQLRRHDIDLWLRMIAGRTWCYDTARHAGYRLDTPSSISKAGLECHYYYMRAMDRNAPLYRTQEAVKHRQRLARLALAATLTDGTKPQLQTLMPLCRPYMGIGLRLFFAVCDTFRPVSIPVIRFRRRLRAKLLRLRGKAVPTQEGLSVDLCLSAIPSPGASAPVRTLPISVVIPTRNRTSSLAATVTSLLRQSKVPAEILIVDASPELVHIEEPLPAGVQLIHLTAATAGAAAQRNQGAGLATQPYILFADDDVLLEADCCEWLWAALQGNPGIGGVSALIVNQCYRKPGWFSSMIFAWFNGGRASTYAGRCLGPGLTLLPEDCPELPEVVPVDWIPTTTALYRREALSEPPFAPIFVGASLAEDLALSLQVAKQWKLANVRKARIWHAELGGEHKRNLVGFSEMQVINRHYIMHAILNRRSWRDELQFWTMNLLLLPGIVFQPRGLRCFPLYLLGRLRALIRIIAGRDSHIQDTSQ